MPKLSKQTTIARRKKDFEERKIYILNTAEEIFRVKGYLSATTDEIAEKAGISVGTIYNLFRNFSASLTSSRLHCNFREALPGRLPGSIASLASQGKVLFSLA